MQLIVTEEEKRNLPPTDWEGKGRKTWLEVLYAVPKDVDLDPKTVTLAELKKHDEKHDEFYDSIDKIVDNIDSEFHDDSGQRWLASIVPDNKYDVAEKWVTELNRLGLGLRAKIKLYTRKD
jgi:hypothetical protein